MGLSLIRWSLFTAGSLIAVRVAGRSDARSRWPLRCSFCARSRVEGSSLDCRVSGLPETTIVGLSQGRTLQLAT